MKNFTKWLETFIEEKDLVSESWEVAGPDGTPNIFSTEVIIEAIKEAPVNEQAGIKNTLVKIDFINGSVNRFFKHLSQALAVNGI